MSRERRKNARTRKRLKIEYGEEELSVTGFGLDISPGGLFITANKLLPIGTRIHLHVDAARGFYAEGLVVRHKLTPSHLRTIEPQGLGVRFLLPGEIVEPLLHTPEPALDVPQALRVTCGSPRALAALVGDQLARGVVVVPLGASLPAAGDRLDFEILLAHRTPAVTVAAKGRVLQILENAGTIAGSSRGAVVEVEEARALVARLSVMG